jgi:hypothetical protein
MSLRPKERAIVTDGRILRGMARQGFIVWQPRTADRHWTGARIRQAVHVHAGPRLADRFEVFRYRGVDYRLRYFDGCFKPFVTRLDRALSLPAFV